MINPTQTSDGRVHSHVVDGIVTIRIDGRFDLSCRNEFRQSYETLGPMREYVLDLAATEYLDSSALGMLLVLRDAVAPARMRIVNGSAFVRRIMKIANFQTLFSVE